MLLEPSQEETPPALITSFHIELILLPGRFFIASSPLGVFLLHYAVVVHSCSATVLFRKGWQIAIRAWLLLISEELGSSVFVDVGFIISKRVIIVVTIADLL